MNINKISRLQHIVYIILIVLVLCPSEIYASESKDAKRILSLIDYIGGDYQNAVQNGEIINENEYQEMLEFSGSAKEFSHNIKSNGSQIKYDVESLNKLIIKKADIQSVVNLSDKIKNDLISEFQLNTYPDKNPSLKTGKILYANNCSQCHGITGNSDTPIAQGLEPRPANFSEGDLINGLSAFKVYNTVNFGIKGTGMPSFPNLTEEEKWDVAFYALALRYEDDSNNNTKLNFPDKYKDIKVLATLSDDNIRADLSSSLSEDEVNNTLAQIRVNNSLGKGSLSKESEPLLLAGSLLSESVKLYEQGNKELAYTKAIDAYLEGFEKVENKLALKDKQLTVDIEGKFNEFRTQLKGDTDIATIKKTYSEIDDQLGTASLLLSDTKPLGKLFSFLQSFAIIVREGLEAVLIVAAILAFLSTTGSKKAVRYVHYGWISALIAGFFTWLLAQTVISITSAQREIIEGATSLIAAAVLFYVSYWFITKIEVQKWKEFIEGKVKQALTTKNVITLASVSFFAVYREAFETVLFYQALWLQAENTQSEVIWGLVVGSIFMLGIFVVIFKLGLRMPLRHFFGLSSGLLYLLSFVLVGKGIKEFQEAGMIGITPLEFMPHIDLLGIYPTLQTSIPQAILFVAFIVAILWIFVVNQERERKEIVISVTKIAEDMKTMHEAFDHIKGHIIEWKRCEDIDLEAEDLDKQIHDVINHVDELETKLGDFFDVVSKNGDDEGAKPSPRYN